MADILTRLRRAQHPASSYTFGSEELRDAADEIERLRARIAELEADNDSLRGLLGNSAKDCPYCGLPAIDQSKCARGFPGCSRADDQLLSKHFSDGYFLEQCQKELAAIKQQEPLGVWDGQAIAMQKWVDIPPGTKLYLHPAPITEGWQLVPKEPTPAMLMAPYHYADVPGGRELAAYKAMLASAPKPGDTAPIHDNQQGSWLDELALKMAREIMSTTKLILRGGDTQMLARIQVLIRNGLEIASASPGDKP